jgi:hypothetical protein
MHRHDLERALHYLGGIDRLPTDLKDLAEGLWDAAIVHFMKCFGQSASRFSLQKTQIYGADSGALATFEFYKDLRNKHLAHDENGFAMPYAGAFINGPGAATKVAQVVCLNQLTGTLADSNRANLRRLIDLAIVWVAQEFDKVCDSLKKDLESVPLEQLLLREDLRPQPVSPADVGTPRS